MRTFSRVYYATLALTLAGCTCLPWLVPLSYRVLGFDPDLAYTDTVIGFQAHTATASLRRGFISGVMVLALSLIALSLAAMVLRVRRRTGLPWVVLVLTTAGATGVAAMAAAALVAGGSGMCC